MILTRRDVVTECDCVLRYGFVAVGGCGDVVLVISVLLLRVCIAYSSGSGTVNDCTVNDCRAGQME